jgi:hypothetical protein
VPWYRSSGMIIVLPGDSTVKKMEVRAAILRMGMARMRATEMSEAKAFDFPAKGAITVKQQGGKTYKPCVPRGISEAAASSLYGREQRLELGARGVRVSRVHVASPIVVVTTLSGTTRSF